MKTNGLFQLLLFLVGGMISVQAQVLNEAWVQRYNREGLDSLDKGRRVAADHAGNVIVVGTTDNGLSGGDWLVIKYTGAGVPLWTNRCSGPGMLSDNVNALAVAPDNTVIVAGSFYNSNAIVAYSETGAPLWTNQYSGGYATAVAVSPSGTVFVTGNSGGASDFLTVAYTAAGVPLWTNRYDGPGHYTDSASALAVGPDGTVFVTGHSYGSAFDIATIAYTEAGATLWIRRYSGPGTVDDLPNAIAVGADGTVYVAGVSDQDCITLAYSAAGVPLWTKLYNGPTAGHDEATAIALNSGGTVFVTGYSIRGSGFGDYATLAYSGAGVPLWTNRFCGPGTNNQACAIAVGTDDSVFVTGYSSAASGSPSDYATIAYTPAGAPIWTNLYDGPANDYDQPAALAVSADGTVFVTGTSGISSSVGYSFDCATLACTGAGVPLWTNRYNVPAKRSDEISAVAVDTNGTVFVTGKSLDTLGRNDFDTIAYSAAGVPVWTNRYNGAGNSDDVPGALALGPGGTVYVAGYSAGSTVMAYSGAGIPLWTNTYYGVGVSGMAVGPDGTAFLTGYTGGKGSICVTRAVSGAGLSLWTNIHGGPASSAVAVGPSGDVFVACAGYTIAFSSSGVPLWTNRYLGGSVNALAVSPGGNVFVTGVSSNDFMTVAYSGAGIPLWVNRYNGPGNSNDTATALGLSADGTVFVSGYSGGIGSFDYATIAYSAAGVSLWTNRYDGPGNGSDQANALVVGPDGSVFVSGNSFNASGFSDYVTVAYSQAGMPLSTNRYNGPASGNDIVGKYSLALAPDGVVVAGKSAAIPVLGAASDFAVVKYVTTPVGNPPDANNPPAPTITLSPSGEAQITFFGTAGSSYVLEHTFDLGSNSWAPVQTNTAALNGSVPFIYLPLGPLNFWRIRPLSGL